MMKDLVMVVSDKNMRFAFEGLLSNPQKLQIRTIRYDIPSDYWGNDPGCLRKGHAFLRPFQQLYQHAMLVFDRMGCGEQESSREQLESMLEENIRRTGWQDRAAAIVIDPELENWVWSVSPHVADCLGWKTRLLELRQWLHEQRLWTPEQPKPHDPKKAMEEALKAANKRRSSSIYKDLASQVSFAKCQDPAFLIFKHVLQQWFPQNSK